MTGLVEPVEPDFPSFRDVALERISQFAPAEHAEWLTDAVLSLARSGAAPVSDEAALRSVFDDVSYSIEWAFDDADGHVDAALLRTLLELPWRWIGAVRDRCANPVDPGAAEVLLRELIPLWVREWRGGDWSSVLLQLPLKGFEIQVSPDRFRASLRVLEEADLVAPERMVDIASLETGAGATRREHWGLCPPTTLSFWIDALGPRAVERIGRLVDTVSRGEAGEVALAIFDATCVELGRHKHSRSGQLAVALLSFVRKLGARLDDHLEDDAFVCAYLGATLRLTDGLAGDLTVEERAAAELTSEELQRSLSISRRVLGRARRRAAEEAVDVSRPAAEFYRLHVYALALISAEDGLWPAWKSLLLLLRALKTQVVGNDLSLVPSERLSAAEVLGARARPPWSWVGREFLRLLHKPARDERKRDAGLVRFRDAFARFCLDRLKTKKAPRAGDGSNPELVEPDSNWRMCYIRAIRELRANPENRGHHVLHWSMRNDPDESVRRAARTAYGEMNKTSRIPSDMSPRRLVFAALWWLRQAHVLSVGGKIDSQGARRTRQREVREAQLD